MLVLTRRPEESIVIRHNGEVITITVLNATDGKARLGFEAPDDYLILRKELDEVSHGP